MARVLFYTGISLLAISAILLYLPACFAFIVAVFLVLAITFCLIFRKRIFLSGLITLLSISLLFSIFGIFTLNSKVTPAKSLEGYKAEVVGTVKDWPIRYEDYSVYVLESESITIKYDKNQKRLSSVPQKLKLRLSDINNIDADVFDKIKVEVVFNPLDEYKNSSLSNGVYAGGYIENLLEFKGKNRPFYACFYDLKKHINKLIYDNINYDEATVISAVLIGDLSRLSDEFYYNSKAAGVTHVLVVSGMHLGIIFQFLMIALGVFKVSKRFSAVVLIGFIFVVSAICGFTPSVLRSGLTYLIIAVGMLIYRRPDPLNSLGAATIIILFTGPFGFGNISLLLSLLSTFGILYICPILYLKASSIVNKMGLSYKPVNALIFALCQTLSATLATAPVNILCFGYISAIAPIANILIGYAVSVLLVLSLITVVILALPSVLKVAATLPIIAMCLIVRYVVWAVEICASRPWAVFATNIVFLIPWFLLFITVCLIPAQKLVNKPFMKKLLKISSVIILCFAILIFGICYNFNKENIESVLSLGDTGSVILNIDNVTVAIGAGDTKNDVINIKNQMLSIGANKLDYLILPSLEKSVSGGAPRLITRLKPTKVILTSQGEYKDKLSHISNDSFLWFNNKSAIKPTPDTEIFVIANIGAVVNTMDYSLIISFGKGINNLYKLSNKSEPILILVNEVNEEFKELNLSKIVLSGNEDSVKNMKNRLKNLTVPITEVYKNNYVIGRWHK